MNTKELTDEDIIKAAMVCLSSKVVSKNRRKLAEIALEAVKSVFDFERKEINLDLIKIASKPGGELGDTELVKGIIIDKEFSHP